MADHPQDNEFLDHALMEETRLYVERGRNLKDRSDEDVLNVCRNHRTMVSRSIGAKSTGHE